MHLTMREAPTEKKQASPRFCGGARPPGNWGVRRIDTWSSPPYSRSGELSDTSHCRPGVLAADMAGDGLPRDRYPVVGDLFLRGGHRALTRGRTDPSGSPRPSGPQLDAPGLSRFGRLRAGPRISDARTGDPGSRQEDFARERLAAPLDGEPVRLEQLAPVGGGIATP